MFCFRNHFISAATLLGLVFALTLALPAQTRGTKIEVTGNVSQINPEAGTFVIESLTVATTPATRYEDRQDRTVTKESFFSDLHENDRVEVDGRLKGNAVTAHKIEIEHH